MSTTDLISRSKLDALTAPHTAALEVESYAARAAAAEVAKAAVNRAAEADRAQRERDSVEASAVVASALVALDDRAEKQRRRCAERLLGEAFDTSDPKSLVALISKWRSEPTRGLTLAIQERWRELDARSRAQLGAALGEHVLAVPFVDAIAAAVPGALVYLSTSYDFGTFDRSVEALDAFTRVASTPSAAQTALGEIEACLIVAGRRGAGQTVEAVHVQRHALRRAHATRGDLMAALGAFDAEVNRADNAAFRAAYTPPSRQPPPMSPRWFG